ncbi:protein NAP1-like isoform X1 [Salvia splendens]|uniref:protein NAP1-like isoform X1 n=2 Tax=Salvia splendens TaxID=180675 RepID=UPI001C26706D|nr:protein NAP1-like isoform X1 [Salvia splendens]XP_042021313.1 protein NAP1-like isoform X1 [Salvia splendens]XP_042021315.1 protein NAP1-like isoform X1 [Salvia splendens]XP_042021316.1 protein NAP1-like isoform X1 [Salvia splendens]
MAKSRPNFPAQDVLSAGQGSVRSREWEGPTRWTEYLGPDVAARSNGGAEGVTSQSASSSSQKGLNMQWVYQLTHVAEGLMAKMYRLNQILDYPDLVNHAYSEAFWKAGLFPNQPKICILLEKKFPEHHSKLQLERADKLALDAMYDSAEVHLQSMEPWIQLLLDLMAFREQSLRLILDLSSTVITLLPHQNSLILHAFMDLFCSFVRVNLFSEKIPRKMMLQTYNLLYSMARNDRDCDFYHRLIQFVDSYDPPFKGLHEDLNFVSPRIGEVLEAVGPIIFLSTDTRKLRNEGFLSPFHPRYPDILTNSAHPMRAQDLANVTSYREWVLFGYLVCPDELLRVTSIDIALVVLKENLVLTLFRDEYILLHEDYQLYVLPRILESKKMAKSGRTKQKEADLEYSVAKQVEKMISEVHEQALHSCDSIHHERRIMLKQEIGRMVLFFTDQPSLLAPNIQMVFSALAFAQSEVLWYFQHVGVASSKSKTARVVSVENDPNDPTIGFLLDGMDQLCCLVRKYIAAIRGYALSYLSSCAGRIRFLLGTPGMVALDLDATLKGLFQRIVLHLENIPKPQGENISTISCDLSDLRKDWLTVLMIVTSARSSINIRHLEKATVSTGKEGLLSEGNAAYNWSRCVDELEAQLSKFGGLKKLYFNHQHLTTVFRNTMFGPEGRPQHCCAWLGVASSFPECASPIVPEEVTKIGRDAVLYVESLIESIMGGLEGLINILDSDGGFGSLEMQLLPDQAANLMNLTSRLSIPSAKSPKASYGFHLPGYESYPENNSSIKMLEAAMQRLTNLCSVLNDMEPICVLNHVFVLREYMRECILGNFKRRLLTVLKTDSDLQRPSVLESLICRHTSIVHLAEQHVSMDLTNGIREILLAETYSGPVSSLQLFEKSAEQQTGSATEAVCNWYIENIVKDVAGAGILFAPLHRCFKSTRPVGGYFAESVTDLMELKAFVRTFGSYGVDRLDRMLKEHTAALLNCIDTTLRANRENLEAVAGSMHSGDRMETEANIKQIVDMDTMVRFCIQAGQAIAFDSLLAEASGIVLKEGAPLIHSLLTGVAKHLPDEIPETKEIRRMRRVANSVNVFGDHDFAWIRLILEEVGGATDGSWSLLPYLFATFMTSNIWYTTAFNVETGGFSNNVHCLARCICAVIAGSELVRLEREYRQKHSLSNGHISEPLDPEAPNYSSIDASIKSTMQLFIKFSAGIILDSWSESNRSHLMAKLIFLDQICEISPHIPRSTLESHVPYTILRSIYSQYYSNSATPFTPISGSPRHSPAMSLAHASPSLREPRGDSTPQSNTHDSGYPKHSSTHGQDQYEMDNFSMRSIDSRNRNVRRSGPLDYNLSRKSKFAEGSTSTSTGPSPLPRFVESRSGPLSYK